MKIQNAFRLGLFGGLGVIVALGIGAAVGSLATVLTYVGAALFLALGLDPLVSFLARHRWPRALAIVAVLAAVLGAMVGLVFALIPVVVDQVGKLITQVQKVVPAITHNTFWNDVHHNFPWLPVDSLQTQFNSFVKGLDVASIGNGILSAGVSIATGVAGAVVVFILTLYFVSSLASIKRGLYQLVPASKRPGFIDLAEQISEAVGKYVMGQGALGLVNGLLSFIFLTLVFPLFGAPVDYSVLLAFIALLGSLIPLVGTISSSVVITLAVWLFNGTPSVIFVGIYYAVYMQVEAYVISPRIMKQAVSVPGVVVVIAALAGGTLLGVLGALVAIPVAASILLVIKQVAIPRQNAL
ncbi:AI-2E family transporter [Galbitalea soli]|uniref:AI-2E family transporter n=1 Tax=Galbitalea soli TaxID=1268042 RepID=A0A7C9TRV6_9MICO|nr:AI-2E family transporter [Galbitalea soli]NEM91582.1 AI-2E family transporter [Galbitalea soli]NYJ30276.1 putative PurR-regulated permease PerM [Galbitalea soli]